MTAAGKKPVLVQLDMDFSDGGSSPWFNSKGRSTIARLTSAPENADLFTELAHDGSMGALVSYMDTEQPSVSSIALLCYVLTAMALLELFVVLPLAALGPRRYTAAVGLIPWLIFELVLLGSSTVQLICLLAMITTWYGMQDGLDTKAPQAYEWTFELLRNYTQLTVMQLKEAKDPDANLDKSLTATTKSINWMQANLSAWEGNFAGYAALKAMLTGPLPLLQMGILGLALGVTVGSALLACGAWTRRKMSLEKGGRSPVLVAVTVMAGAVLLLTHIAVALPTIARWLPVCVLTDTYVCGPYRDGSFTIIDDGVSKIWSPASRPEPFCRLVPSALYGTCSSKHKAGIKNLPECSSKAKEKNLTALEDYSLHLQQQPLPSSTEVPKGNVVIGDCFYPYKIIDTDWTAVCPLFTDDLVGHWMALVISVMFGMVTAFAAGAIAIIFLAVGKKKKKKITKKKVVRKKRPKKKKEAPPPSPPPPPRPPPPPPTPAPPELVDVGVQVPIPVPIPILRRRRRRAPRPRTPVIMMPPPRCCHPPQPPPPPPPPAFVPQPLLFPTPLMASMMPSYAVPSPAVLPAAPSPATPPEAPNIMTSCSGENQQAALAYTNVNVYGGSGGAAWPYAPTMGMALPAALPGYQAMLSPQMGAPVMVPAQPTYSAQHSAQRGFSVTLPGPTRTASVQAVSRSSPVVRRSRTVLPTAEAVTPSRRVVQEVVNTVQPFATSEKTYVTRRRQL